MAERGKPVGSTTLEVRRTFNATAERLFAAWTDPAQLAAWWGPEGVACIGAEVDLRVGAKYRIGNRLPDGTEIWIVGEFSAIERPQLLRYSWLIEGTRGSPETVTVRFEQRNAQTEVIVTHEKIPNEAARDQHAFGWKGCLDGLTEFVG
jgi:uncharacterized protein YndB with AHSA1/START domain